MSIFNDDRLKRALQVVELDKAVKRLQPHKFSDRISELSRGGLPSTSIPGGSRSAETPIPQRDAADVWLDDQRMAFDAAVKKALDHLRDAFGAQNSVLEVIDRQKAQELLSDSEQGEYRFICAVCEQWFKRTKHQRPRAGRCRFCYDWWVDHGRGPEVPPQVIARRLERQLEREAEAG